MATILARVTAMNPAIDGVEFHVEIISDEGATATIQVEVPIEGIKGNRVNNLLIDAVEQHLDLKFAIKKRGGDKILLVGGIV